jgi:hypothetical protein
MGPHVVATRAENRKNARAKWGVAISSRQMDFLLSELLGGVHAAWLGKVMQRI